MEHTLIQGPRGGFYWLDENGAKHYISGKAKKVAKAAKSGKTNTKNVKPAVKTVTPKSSVVKRRYTGWFNVYNENGSFQCRPPSARARRAYSTDWQRVGSITG